MNGSARHPEAQVMAAFVEGRLTPAEIREIGIHLGTCAECRTVVSETARFQREEGEGAEPRAVPRRTVWIAVAAGLTGFLIAATVLLNRSIERQPSPVEHLIAAAPRDHRVVEARLAGFKWAQLRPPERGATEKDPGDLKLAGAAGDVLAEVERRRDAESRHAAGLAYVLTGDHDRGVAALQQAAAHSHDAAVWSDLSAALLNEADEMRSPQKLPDALAAADHALRLDPANAAALFNRALVIEHIGVEGEARKAWQHYLAVDSSSAWSEEARAHLGRLAPRPAARFDPKGDVRQLVRDFPNEARAWGESAAMGEVADAELAGNHARAAATLAHVRDLAGALALASGDHLLEDAVSAVSRSGGAPRFALLTAHQLYARGEVVRKTQPDVAEPQFRRAADLFASAGSPMADAAAHLAATAAFDQSRDVYDELAQLARRVDGARYPDLLARIHWHLALNENRAGDWGAGVRNATLAAAAFRQLGARTNAAVCDQIGAYALEIIGDTDAAWLRRIAALRVDCADAPVRCNAALSDIATTLAAVGRTDAAAAVANLSDDEAASDPANAALAAVKRARVLALAGDADRARSLLTGARRAALRTPAPKRVLLDAMVAVEEGGLARTTNPAAAMRALDGARAFFEGRNLRYFLPYLHLQRARAERSMRDDGAAVAEYAAALRAAAAQQSAIDDQTFRLTFLDTAGEAAQEAIELALSRGDAEMAFEIADARHGIASNRSGLPTVRTGTAVVEYAVLPRSLAIFCITARGLTTERVAVDRLLLGEHVDAFNAAIRRRAPEAEIHRQGAALFHLLIGPIRPQLAGVRTLVVVSDRQLYAVPFAALSDGNRFLLEDFVVRLAPAARAVAANSARLKSAALEPALVVADPDDASVPSLRAGREEAARIASMYRGMLLAGSEATPARFAAAAEQSALIHYTGHAESGAATYGALLLSGRILGAREVAGLSLKRQPFVILAACGTFRGDPAHVAGTSSLARAFLAAGARGVVGTLWEIDDDVSAQLFIRFHETLRAGASPADALRDAQLAMLHSADARLAHPATWSPVELVQSSL